VNFLKPVQENVRILPPLDYHGFVPILPRCITYQLPHHSRYCLPRKISHDVCNEESNIAEVQMYRSIKNVRFAWSARNYAFTVHHSAPSDRSHAACVQHTDPQGIKVMTIAACSFNDVLTGPPQWSSCQSSWLQKGDILSFQ
jgi:hypothetical protein